MINIGICLSFENTAGVVKQVWWDNNIILLSKVSSLSVAVISSWSELQSSWINTLFGDWGRQCHLWRGRVTEVRLPVVCVRVEDNLFPSCVSILSFGGPITVSFRAGSVCSMESFPVLSRASSRNIDRDWENGSIASSITSMEYNGEQKCRK